MMTSIRIEIEPEYADIIIELAKQLMPSMLHLRTKNPNVHQFSSPDPHDIYKLGLLNGAFFKDKILKK